jgi:hypothetical protein
MHFAFVPPPLALEEVFQGQEPIALSAKTLADGVVWNGDHVSSLLQAGVECVLLYGSGVQICCTPRAGRCVSAAVVLDWGLNKRTHLGVFDRIFFGFLDVKMCCTASQLQPVERRELVVIAEKPARSVGVTKCRDVSTP